jgi:hypothetical protein
MNVQDALIACAIIGAIFGVILIVAGAGSVESAAGHFVKDTLKGTVVEQPASSIEAAGNSLTSWADGAVATFSGLLLLLGLIYVGVNSKS